MEGCASFLLDWLIDGKDGYLETNPSTSPEHMFIAPDGKPASVSYSTTMDMAITKEVFSSIISAAEGKLFFRVHKTKLFYFACWMYLFTFFKFSCITDSGENQGYFYRQGSKGSS